MSSFFPSLFTFFFVDINAQVTLIEANVSSLISGLLTVLIFSLPKM